MDNNIEMAKQSRSIQHATAEEISALTETVIEADKELGKANMELEMLNSAMNSLETTKGKYNELSSLARKKMQRLATNL